MSNLRSAIDELDSDDPAAVSTAELGEELAELFAAEEKLAAQVLRRLAVYASKRGFEDEGYPSVTSWMVHRCGLSPGRARLLFRLASALKDTPFTMAAFAAGRLDTSRVRCLAEARRAHREAFAADEATLVGTAMELSGRRLAAAVEYWRLNLDDGLKRAATCSPAVISMYRRPFKEWDASTVTSTLKALRRW